MTELGRVVLLLAISVALLAVAQIVEPAEGERPLITCVVRGWL